MPVTSLKGGFPVRPILDLSGKRFGKLTVLRMADNNRTVDKTIKWVCKCDCGKTKIVVGKYLKRGNTKSCGCMMRGYKGE